MIGAWGEHLLAEGAPLEEALRAAAAVAEAAPLPEEDAPPSAPFEPTVRCPVFNE